MNIKSKCWVCIYEQLSIRQLAITCTSVYIFLPLTCFQWASASSKGKLWPRGALLLMFHWQPVSVRGEDAILSGKPSFTRWGWENLPCGTCQQCPKSPHAVFRVMLCFDNSSSLMNAIWRRLGTPKALSREVFGNLECIWRWLITHTRTQCSQLGPQSELGQRPVPPPPLCD